MITKTVFFNQMFTFKVPSEPPFNQREKQTWEKFWPISFNPVERKLEFTGEEKLFFQECMRNAVEIAKLNKQNGNLPIGVVIVNSSHKKIISSSADCRHEYPLDHAVFKYPTQWFIFNIFPRKPKRSLWSGTIILKGLVRVLKKGFQRFHKHFLSKNKIKI